MPYVFLAVTLIGALGVLNAYRPARREPLTVPSFVAGWLVGELPIQNIVWQAVATVLFGLYGAFTAWAGLVGLFITGASWVGLVGLAVVGHRADGVVADALGAASGPPLARVPISTKAEWGRWWRLTQAVPLRGRHVEVIENIDYWGDGIKAHRLDIVRSRRNPPRSAPVMVYIHGGGWVIGDKREQGKPMMYELVARGWVCVAVNYRLSPRATWPDHIVDCKRALAWVKEHIGEHGGDPSFVALSGGSAGGHLCALAALTPGEGRWQPGFESADTSVDACVPFYGVMDMTGDEAASGKYGPGLRRMLERQVMKVTVDERPDVFVEASPTFRVHRAAPPFFVLHGTNDTLVPIEVARRFVSALRRVSKAPVVYAELPLAQHAFDVLASLRCQATTTGVVDFLEAVRAGGHRPAGADEAGGGPVEVDR
jgi:acetyl esterase/lipase